MISSINIVEFVGDVKTQQSRLPLANIYYLMAIDAWAGFLYTKWSLVIILLKTACLWPQSFEENKWKKIKKIHDQYPQYVYKFKSMKFHKTFIKIMRSIR